MQLQNTNPHQYTRSRWYQRALRRSDVTRQDARTIAHGLAAIALGAIVGVAIGIIIGALVDTHALAISLGAAVGGLTGAAVAAIVAVSQATNDEVDKEGWE